MSAGKKKSRWDQHQDSHKGNGDKKSFNSEDKKDTQKVILAVGSKRKSMEPEKSSTSFALKTNTNKLKDKSQPLVQQRKPEVASVFNNESDSEEEEMPLECRMKMRNIGRDTVTSAGPKSYNKGKTGFTNNSYKQFELSMKPRNNMEKPNELYQ